jgi:hypothetical protein
MAARFLIAALFAAAASAQSIDKTFYQPRAESPAELQTIVNIVRSIGDIQHVEMDFSHKAIDVSGNAGQIAFTDWLCHELDNPAAGQPPREYRMQNADPSIVRIYYLTSIQNPQQLQEVVNAIRSVSDLQRFFPDNSLNAVVMRGTSDQVAAADWLIHQLDQPAPAKTSADFPMPGIPGQVAKVFAVVHLGTPQGLQETVNLTRSIADIQRFFPFNAHSEIVARGTAEQIALAGWLLQQLDQPAVVVAPPAEYRIPDKFNPVIRIAYLANTTTPAALQETVNAVRSATQMQRAFPSYLRKAIAMRGTADQISRADLLIKERDTLH